MDQIIHSYLRLDVPLGEGGLALLEAVSVGDGAASAPRVVGVAAVLPLGGGQGALPRQGQPQPRPGLAQLETRRVQVHQTPLWLGSERERGHNKARYIKTCIETWWMFWLFEFLVLRSICAGAGYTCTGSRHVTPVLTRGHSRWGDTDRRRTRPCTGRGWTLRPGDCWPGKSSL